MALEASAAQYDYMVRGASGPLVRHVDDESSGETSVFVVTVEDGVDLDLATAAVGELWGVHTTVDVQLQRPLPALLRAWIDEHGDVDLERRLTLIERALSEPR